jgi:nucleotide-binding universal stress UspA family protein
VTLVHVIASPIETLDGAPEPGPALEDWLQERQEAWAEHLGSVAAEAPAGVEVATRALRGSPAPALVDLIDEAAPDLAIAGTHGVGLRRYLLGSVSQRLLEGARCDLLLFRGGAWGERPLSVIVGMDESENARRALQRGQALASFLSACLVLVHVSDYRIPFAMADARLSPAALVARGELKWLTA